MNPIVGTLYRCETCPVGPDNDLCSACYEEYRTGQFAHPAPEFAASSSVGPHQFSRNDAGSSERYDAWLDTPARVQPAPEVPDHFLVRPEFLAGRESAFGGYGFTVWFQGHPLLLTALHVMDELIKSNLIDSTARNPHYSGDELPSLLTGVRLYDVLMEQWPLHEIGRAGAMLKLPNARTADAEPFSFRDIAAFHLPTLSSLRLGQLADQDPQPGDAVWLAGAIPGGSRTRRATCVESNSRSLLFRYEEVKGMPKHSSGAPILDAAGAVVGINSGLGRFAGRDLGHANPVSSIRTHLSDALHSATAAAEALAAPI